jgi:hypothetical protein
MEADRGGSYRADLVLNDAEGDLLFVFTLEGDVADFEPPSPAADAIVIDNGDEGFDAGSFVGFSGQGFEDDVHFSRANWGRTASWTFSDLAAGIYRVSATWSARDNFASVAPFAVIGDADTLATISVNQRNAPASFQAGLTSWQDLGGPFAISQGQLVVELSDVGSDGYVIADAIRLERLGPIPSSADAAGEGEAEVPDGLTDALWESDWQSPLAAAQSADDWDQLLSELASHINGLG